MKRRTWMCVSETLARGLNLQHETKVKILLPITEVVLAVHSGARLVIKCKPWVQQVTSHHQPHNGLKLEGPYTLRHILIDGVHKVEAILAFATCHVASVAIGAQLPSIVVGQPLKELVGNYCITLVEEVSTPRHCAAIVVNLLDKVGQPDRLLNGHDSGFLFLFGRLCFWFILSGLRFLLLLFFFLFFFVGLLLLVILLFVCFSFLVTFGVLCRRFRFNFHFLFWWRDLRHWLLDFIFILRVSKENASQLSAIVSLNFGSWWQKHPG
mmetsp:Transcript_65215/g.108313  ORF Transcript_65215/g.108313 Transcript_65215/m.108313 type:complete len:267 (-) Transcript_65215:261-1061(-)